MKRLENEIVMDGDTASLIAARVSYGSLGTTGSIKERMNDLITSVTKRNVTRNELSRENGRQNEWATEWNLNINNNSRRRRRKSKYLTTSSFLVHPEFNPLQQLGQRFLFSVILSSNITMPTTDLFLYFPNAPTSRFWSWTTIH